MKMQLVILGLKDSALNSLSKELNCNFYGNDEVSDVADYIAKIVSNKDNKSIIETEEYNTIEIEKYDYNKLISSFKNIFIPQKNDIE